MIVEICGGSILACKVKTEHVDYIIYEQIIIYA